jgi:hypothetical protein
MFQSFLRCCFHGSSPSSFLLFLTLLPLQSNYKTNCERTKLLYFQINCEGRIGEGTCIIVFVGNVVWKFELGHFGQVASGFQWQSLVQNSSKVVNKVKIIISKITCLGFYSSLPKCKLLLLNVEHWTMILVLQLFQAQVVFIR